MSMLLTESVDPALANVQVGGPAIGSDSFVTKSGSSLHVDGKPFRFSGANIYWLGLDENVMNTTTGSKIGYPSRFRVEDALATAAEMGATVVRSHTLGISTGNRAFSLEGIEGTFDSSAVWHIDYAIARAKAHRIRLIIPLTDNWHYYHGGKFDFVKWALNDKDYKENCTTGDVQGAHWCPFYSHSRVIGLFKEYVRNLLTHKNVHTGVALKDDPTILAWETGNELVGVPPRWTAEIVDFIRHDIGARQLLMDGRDSVRMGFEDGSLSVDNIDIVTSHLYGEKRALLSEHAQKAKSAGKVFIIGEFDWKHGDLRPWLEEVEANDHIAGDLYWSLLPHADDFGFVPHDDGFTVHYPGNSSKSWTRLDALRVHAYQMRGIKTPAHGLSRPPSISWTRGQEIAWRGAAGANEYTVEVAERKDGPWRIVCDHCATDFDLPWRDHERDVSRRVWYRVQGINMDEKASNFSEPFLSEASTATAEIPRGLKAILISSAVAIAVIAVCLPLRRCFRRYHLDDADAREVLLTPDLDDSSGKSSGRASLSRIPDESDSGVEMVASAVASADVSQSHENSRSEMLSGGICMND